MASTASAPLATLRAVAHVSPAARPFLAPGERQSADRTRLYGQFTLLQNDSPASSLASSFWPRFQSASCLASVIRLRFL